MQVFVPATSFRRIAEVLDDKRLGKQRVECLQILKSIFNSTGWKHHPAVKMWHGSTRALIEYAISICIEWRRRGFNDSLLPMFKSMRRKFKTLALCVLPPWWGDERVHSSHRAALLHKAEQRYFEHDDPKAYDWYDQWGLA